MAERSAEQWIPLWNPLDQTGIPLIGETTTAIFYPPRYVIYALPLDTDTATAWYVVFHLVVAYLAAARAARWSSCSPIASSVAGVVYALSGSVLFLYCNPPFLVGAAWLPLLVGVLLNPERVRPMERTSIASVAMAMMVLGGDPQSALHGVLIGVVSFVIWSLSGGRNQLAGVFGQLTGLFGPLVVACLLAAAMTAPQLGASIHWSLQSERVAVEDAGDWWRSPDPGSIRQQSFDYSTPPWRLVELISPAVSGSLFPRYHRLETLFPVRVRVWTPTLFMGTFALLACLSRLFSLRRYKADRWLLLAAVGFTCSLGAYGLVWFVHSLTGLLPRWFGALGGPYWILYEAVPGYDAFRYPSKWLPVFTLGLAIVTAKWTDLLSGNSVAESRALETRRTTVRLGFWLAAILIVAFGSVGCLLLFEQPLVRLGLSNRALPADRFWGPLQIRPALRELWYSLGLSLINLSIVTWSLRRCQPGGCPTAANRTHTVTPATFGLLVLTVTTVELAIVGYHLIGTVPKQLERELMEVARRKTEPEELQPVSERNERVRWLRTQTGGGWPDVWRTTASTARLSDVEASQRLAWFGRWHLAEGAAVFNNMTSIRSLQSARFWSAVHRHTESMSDRQKTLFWWSVRERFGIDGVLSCADQPLMTRVDGAEHVLASCRRQIDRRGPGIRLRDRWRVIDQPATVESWTELFLEMDGRSTNAPPWVHAPESSVGIHGDSGPRAFDPQRVQVLERSAEHSRIAVETAQSTLLTRPVFQDGWWTATLTDQRTQRQQPLPVHQVDYLSQGTEIPAGDWFIDFRYRPVFLKPLLGLAAASWFAIAVWVSWRAIRWQRLRAEECTTTR